MSQSFNARLVGGPRHNKFMVVQDSWVDVYYYDNYRRPWFWEQPEEHLLDVRKATYVKDRQQKNGLWIYRWKK